MRYGLKLEVDDKYRALLVTLSRLTGIKKSNLLLVEIFGATIRVSFDSANILVAMCSNALCTMIVENPQMLMSFIFKGFLRLLPV